MPITKTEDEAEIVYACDDGTFTVTVKKDDNFIDVRQVTPVANAGGQTWQQIRDYLDSK